MADYRQHREVDQRDDFPVIPDVPICSECDKPIELERLPHHSICAKCVDKAIAYILEHQRLDKIFNDITTVSVSHDRQSRRRVMEAQINDLILGTLKLPDPCPIRITIDQSYIRLEIGQRDWQWDLNGKFVGAGTSVETSND